MKDSVKAETYPEQRMMLGAVLEAKKGQVAEAELRGEPLKVITLGGGVQILGAMDSTGTIPLFFLNGAGVEINGAGVETLLSLEQKESFVFLRDKLKLPTWVAALEISDAASISDNWRLQMEEVYGLPEDGVSAPGLFSITGLPEQYKSILATYLSANGETVIDLHPSSDDTLTTYQTSSSLAGKSLEEIVSTLRFTPNSNTLKGNEFWKIVDMNGGEFFVKKQQFLFSGMKMEDRGGLKNVLLTEGEAVVVGEDVSIKRKGQLNNPNYSLKKQSLREFRRVLGDGKRPEIIYADFTGYWMQQGNVSHLAAMESMIPAIIQRFEYTMDREWQVRDDTLRVSVLYDYAYFLAQNKDTLIQLARSREEAVGAAIEGNGVLVERKKEEIKVTSDKLVLNSGHMNRKGFLEKKLSALALWAHGDEKSAVREDPHFKDYIEDLHPNDFQKLMARVLGESGFGEVFGVTVASTEIVTMMRDMLERGSVGFPRKVDGKYVMVDKDGVFVVELPEDENLGEILSYEIGRQSVNVFVKLKPGEKSNSLSLRKPENWGVYGDRVKILPIDNYEQAENWLQEGLQMAKEYPLLTFDDKREMESRGELGRVSVQV